VHNKFNWFRPVTYLSYLIRVVTCSKWNHIAIKIDNQVIESIGKGVVLSDWGKWVAHSNRIVLPLMPEKAVNPNELLNLKGQRYGFFDLIQIFRFIVATRWNGKSTWNGKNFSGYVCSELACVLMGITGFVTPGDFEYMPGFVKGTEFITVKK
jgi:hypothetical protein